MLHPSRLREVHTVGVDGGAVPSDSGSSAVSASRALGHTQELGPPASRARRVSPRSTPGTAFSSGLLTAATSLKSKSMIMNETPNWLPPPGSFYSHITTKFEDRNAFTAPHAAEVQAALLAKLGVSRDPVLWANEKGLIGESEPDELHDPASPDRNGTPLWQDIFSWRGACNLGFGFLVLGALISLFMAYPVIFAVRNSRHTPSNPVELGLNASGQVPTITGNWGLIDEDTPQSAHTITSPHDGATQLQLIFSDEFNEDGRTFYPGDDPYWEAVDLHYWATNNLEWYDPMAITTSGGSLQITLSATPTHNLDYQGGMMQTWNKFCFTGGYIETSVILPARSSIYGLWPAIWAMGNLGRGGYGATLDGMWPYTYDTCDLGTLPNQTHNGQPAQAVTGGSAGKKGAAHQPLSYLPGQRLSACSCGASAESSHPGPKKSDGTWTARNVPEIDVFEAQTNDKTLIGAVSQSAQFAPFDMFYQYNNASDVVINYNPALTVQNVFAGSTYQEATSLVTTTNQECYELGTKCYSTYGFEYQGGSDGWITWVSDDVPSWTLLSGAIGPNAASQISHRVISEEPMYLITNLGLSHNFGVIDFAGLDLLFPVHMSVDYIRVYQDPKNINIGCDPAAFPTADYINNNLEAYTNPNLTTWAQYGGVKPANSLVDTC
ncbi:hypothetical protein FRB97_001437 [Tulasnella sp. 331]|nr:hypothetical protein FRB97_001437 [Tulasnella sp. 331]